MALSQPKVASDALLPHPSYAKPSWIENDFDDDEWLCRSHENRPHRLDFRKLPEPFRLNGKYLLRAIEQVTDTRFNTRRLNSVATFRRYFYDYCKLVSYLVDRGVPTFADVTEKLCLHFARDNWRNDRSPSEGYPTRIGNLYQKLYKLGPRGAGAVPDGLLVSVTAERLERFLGDVQPINETPIIPDSAARAIGNAAIELLEYAEPICFAYECAKDFLRSPLHSSKHNRRATVAAREEFLRGHRDLTKITAAYENIKWLFVTHPDFHEHSPDDTYFKCDLHELLSLNFISHIMQHLVAACFINVALLNGFRSAEVLSIGPGDIKPSGVGTVIRSRIHKTSSRMSGVDVERPGHISMLKVDAVLARVAAAQNRTNYWGLGRGGTLMNMVLSKVLMSFTQEIAEVEDWSLTSRQFRRYFAIFYVYRHHGPEDALRREFRHVTFAALRSYVKDEQNARYLYEANRGVVRGIYIGLAETHGEFGAAESSPTLRRALKYRASNLPLEEIERDLEERLRTATAEVRPTIWGYCLLNKADPLGALCGSESGVPQALEMHPGNCGRCQHLVVSRDHIPFWEGFRETHAGVLQSRAATKLAKEASATGIRIAEDVISRLRVSA